MRAVPVLFALALAVAAIAAACATQADTVVGVEPTAVYEKPVAPPAPTKLAPMSPDEARAIALAHDAAFSCEETARAWLAKDAQRGWAVMQQCVLRPDFSDLETLVSPPWLGHLRRDRRFANLVAHVIAVRGGDVENDLRVLHRARLPVFSLQAALAEPEQYAGKLVVMRGSPAGGHTVAGSRALDLAETRVMAEGAFVNVGPQRQAQTREETFDRTGNGRHPQLEDRVEHTDTPRAEVLHNVSVETGLEVLAQVPGDAPFLETGTDYVLVLRFEGQRESVDESGADGERSVATVVGYYEPESGLFARLGR